MSWRQLSVVVSRTRAELVCASLHAQGASGTQEDWIAGEAPPPRQPWDDGPAAPLPERALVHAWFEDADEAAVASGLARLLAVDTLAGPIEWEDVVEVDYEAQYRDSIKPLVISERLVICPPWDIRPGCLIIEPGQGFGTGDHPTTELALRVLNDAVKPGVRVLDVGAGSGILALAAVLLGGTAYGIDVDPDAVADAHRNAEKNALEVPFDTTRVEDVPGVWDIVVANVHAEILVTMAPALLARTGHLLVLGGILADREHLVREVFDDVLTLVKRDTLEDWVGLTYRKA